MNWTGTSTDVEFRAQRSLLRGTLNIPEKATAVILFVHGSGSSRLSQRNLVVAEALNKAGFATLLFDLLTAEEEAVDSETAEYRFDIPLLTERLMAATAWLMQREETRQFRFGYFGASTGAAAALMAAAQLPRSINAVVSRGGRPEMAARALRDVEAPTLLLVGGLDDRVIDLNNAALQQLKGIKKLQIIPGAGHLFEEPGSLDQVSALASDWFEEYLRPPQEIVRSTAS